MKKSALLLISFIFVLSIGACAKPVDLVPSVDTYVPTELPKTPNPIEQANIDMDYVPAPAPTAKKTMLAFIMPNVSQGFMAESTTACEKYLKEMAGNYPNVEYRFQTSADVSEQINQIDALINDKVDVIVLWPYNGEDIRSSAQTVIEAGIKLIIYNHLIPEIKPACECEMDNFGYGKAAADYINMYFNNKLSAGEKVRILEFCGDNSPMSTTRSEGFKAAKNDNVIIDQSFITDWQKVKGQEYMETFLEKSSARDIAKIEAIFTHDDEISMGIYDAIRNYKGHALNIKLICGMGARRENLDTFMEFKEEFSIDQFTIFVAPGIIKYAVELGYKAASGEDIPKQFKIGYIPVDNLGLTEYTDNTFRNYQGYIGRYADMNT